MARVSADAHTLLINPPSPALTNPDLILPFDGFAPLSGSPPRKQPPSPPDSDAAIGTWNNHGTQLNYSIPMRHSPALGYGTALSIIDEVETTPSLYSSHHGSDAVRSTPTLKNTSSSSLRLDPGWDPKHQRRWSNGSGSIHSDDIENMHWPDFEGPSEVDDESVVLDDEEQLGDLPKIADPEDFTNDEQYVSSHVDSLEDDPLSRRADMILANAKKRLHVMEGNLRGARNSLMLSAPSSPNSSYFSHGDKERPRYSTSAGIYGHKNTTTPHISTQYSQNLGHNRMLSDTSSAHGTYANKALNIPKRSSSALGSFARGLSSLEKSASLRGVRSQQDMRDSRLQSWIEESSVPPEPPRPVTAEPPRTFSPMGQNHKRPGSAASLRSQMDELKGRINSLKAKASEDRSKRLSSMSSTSSSPFTAADKWYNDSASVKSHQLSVETNGGRRSASSPNPPSLHRKKSGSTDEDSHSSRSRKTTERTQQTFYAESTYEDAEDTLGKIREEPEDSDEPSTPSTSVLADEQKVLMGPQDPTDDELGYNVDEILNGQHNRDFEDEEYDRESSPDAASLDGQSEYFDSVPVMAERHEDRADAFDYENFFLHSAMGSYTRDRRDSVSSESSVETTRPSSPKRPSTAMKAVTEASSPPRTVRTGFGTIVEDSPGLHRRSHSVESISTVATFQTATEGAGSNGSDDGDDPLDVVTQRILSPGFQSPAPPSPKRSHAPLTNGVPSRQGHYPMQQHELSAAFLSSLLGTEENGSKDVPATDVALVEGVLSSLQSVVTNLRAQPRDYDKREWRRRLDAAKRALDQLAD